MVQKDQKPELTRERVLVMALVFEGGILLLWIFLSHMLDMPPPSQGEVSTEALLQGLAGTVPLLPLLWLLARSGVPALQRLIKTVDDLLVPLLRPLTTTDFVLVALLAGVGEEGLFRGVLQGYLATVIGDYPAIFAAAAVFGLLHFITPLYALLAGLMGLYLGWLYGATGNLLVPMIVHGLYDFAALLYLVKIRRPERVARTGKEGGQ